MSEDEIDARKKKAERGWLADPPPPPPREYIPGEEHKWRVMMDRRLSGEAMTADHPTRAALAAELGYWPASTDPESVERHRRQAAADAASHAEYLRQYGPTGYRRNQYRHLMEERRRDAVEAAGRAAVADLYE